MKPALVTRRVNIWIGCSGCGAGHAARAAVNGSTVAQSEAELGAAGAVWRR